MTTLPSWFGTVTTAPGPVPLPLAQVVDMDCLPSLSPLSFDLTGQVAVGVSAILRRVLYAWVRQGGLMELDGWTPSPKDLAVKQLYYSKLAEQIDYVQSASVTITFTGSTLSVYCAIAMVDGLTYPLELVASQASVAIQNLGGATL